MRQPVVLGLIAVFLAGCATFKTNDARATEETLTAAGFQQMSADTPEKLAYLRKLTAQKMTVRQEKGRPYYLFADPDTCRCLYVGTQQQYQQYLALRRQQAVADEELLTTADREDALGGVWGLWP